MVGLNEFILDDKNIYLFFPQNKFIQKDIECITGSRCNDVRNCWIIPVEDFNIIHIDNLLHEYNFQEKQIPKIRPRAICSKREIERLKKVCEKFNFTYIPRDYQLEYLAYANKVESLINGDACGCGKTFEAILYTETNNLFPVFVVVPSSVKYNWANEWTKITGRQSVQVIDSTSKNINWDADVIIVNYAILSKDHKIKFPELLKIPFKSAIADEAHFLKNPTAQRSKAAAKIIKPIPKKQLLTGTAILNRPEEIYNLLEIAGVRHKISPNWPHFVKSYCDGHMTIYGWNTKGHCFLQELNQKLRNNCYIRREKREVRDDLPPVTKQIINVPITNKRTFNKAKENLLSYIYETFEGSSEEKFSEMVKANRAYYLSIVSKLKKLTIEGKLKAIENYLKEWSEGDTKLVIFGNSRAILDHLAHKFKSPKLVGGLSAKKKFEVVQDWIKSDDLFLFVNIDAGGTGTDGIQKACSNALVIELPNAGKFDQMIGRVDRVGATDPITITFLLSKDTFDYDDYQNLIKKQLVTEAVNKGKDINKDKNNLSRLWKKMLENLD